MSSDVVAWLERHYDRTMRLEPTPRDVGVEGLTVHRAPPGRYTEHYSAPMFTLKDDHDCFSPGGPTDCGWRNGDIRRAEQQREAARTRGRRWMIRPETAESDARPPRYAARVAMLPPEPADAADAGVLATRHGLVAPYFRHAANGQHNTFPMVFGVRRRRQ